MVRPRVNKANIYDRPIYHGLKRVFDVVFSSLLLILFSWLYLIIAIAIKIEDPTAPVFYLQTRVGQDGHRFKIYKFRSMVPNAAEEKKKLLKYNDIDGYMFKMKHDPRVTKVGRFLRKHSLDELPQLVNVLEGDMAFVGPRPPLPSEVVKYSDYDLQRLLVVPGCTGLWQVSGRNALAFEQMVDLDVQYINHATFWVDFKILCKTVYVMLNPHDAY